MSSPRKRIVPDVGLSNPVMQLTNVVLPAPLGPMTPRISPLRIMRSTPATAASPPKRFVIPRASRRGVASPEGGRREAGGGSVIPVLVSDMLPYSRASPAACRLPPAVLIQPARADVGEQDVGAETPAARHGGEPAEELHQAAGQEDDEEDDDDAQHRRVKLQEVAPDIRREKLIDRRADERPPDRARASHDAGDDHLQRVLDLEEVVGRDVDVLVGDD